MRELIVSIYLLTFKMLFILFSIFPLKNKVTFLVSFPENPKYIYKMLKKQEIDVDVVFLCHTHCFDDFKKLNKATYLVESKHLGHTLIGIYHIATSSQLIIDNYYGFLAAVKFKKAVTCTQVWHAVGAIKQFGAKDPTNIHRTPAAIRRFKTVYKKFDYIVVGSDYMQQIFKKAFLAKDEAFLKTGLPRTDFFFEKKKHQQIRHAFYQANPLLKGKNIILYAPTFRKNETLVTDVVLDIQKMYDTLKEKYILIIKLHPAVKLKLDLTPYQNFAFDYSDYPNMNELLIITDTLMTDYSSIPMEFALLKRNMIFFAYDLEDYQKNNGLWEDYEASVPGPIVKNTDEVIDAVLNHEVNLEQIENYARKWAAFCHGDASERVVNELFKS